MGRSYFYTIASLPMLQFDTPPPMEFDDFLMLCQNTIEPKDYQTVKATTMEIPRDFGAENGVILQYWIWERGLRNALVKVRAKEMDVDGTSFLQQDETVGGVEEIAANAIRYESPLEAEKYIAKQRWDFMDSLRNIEYFSLENLQVWYLQLQLLTRLALFDKEKGFSRYQELYNEILKGHEHSTVNNEVNQ